MNNYKVGDRVWMCGNKWVVEWSFLARVYIRNKDRKMIVPRFDEVKPIKTCYATFGKTGVRDK